MKKLFLILALFLSVNAWSTSPVLVPKLTTLGDQASSTVLYLGNATPGTATSAAKWQISKLTFDGSGNLVSIKWCGGNGNFSNVWNNRAACTYQ